MTIPALPAPDRIAGHARAYGNDSLAFFEQCEALGPIVRARVLHRRFYVVTGPELLEQVLVKRAASFTKPLFLQQLKLIFGDGLLTSNGDLWRHRRRVLQPVFHRSRIAGYMASVSHNVAAMLADWRDGETRNVHGDFIEVCVKNLTEALLGVVDPELSGHVKGLATLCHRLTQALGSFAFPYYAALPFLFRARFGPEVRGRSTALMARVTELRERGVVRASADDFLGRLDTGSDFDGCPFGERARTDEIVTMVLAGHETAAAAVSWAVQLLTLHPEIRRTLALQLDERCGDRPVAYDDLEHLPLLQSVLDETYRLYPPTHRIGRTALEDVVIGGVLLRKGAELVLPQWAVHRSSRHFEAPSEFRPSRWSDDLKTRLHRFAFFPFGGGPRTCIGEALVVAEDAIILANVVKAFDFELVGPSQQPIEGLTLLPGRDETMRVQLKRRHGCKPEKERQG